MNLEELKFNRDKIKEEIRKLTEESIKINEEIKAKESGSFEECLRKSKWFLNIPDIINLSLITYNNTLNYYYKNQFLVSPCILQADFSVDDCFFINAIKPKDLKIIIDRYQLDVDKTVLEEYKKVIEILG